MTDVDVVIPTVLKDEGKLLRAIESALTQSRPPRRVVVVVDSPEPPLPLVSGAGVEVMRNSGPQHGAAAARNIGVRGAASPVVAFLDDDDYWLPGKLQQQMELLAQVPRASIVVSRAHVVDDGGTRITPDRPHRRDEPLADYLFPAPGWRSSPNHSISTPTLLAPRELLLQQPFIEELRQWEDIEWLLRVTDLGIELLWSPEALAVIDQTRTSGPSLSQLAHPEQDEDWAIRFLATRSPQACRNHLLTYAARGYAQQGRSAQALRLIARTLASGPVPLSLVAKALTPIVVPESLYERLKARRHAAG